MTNLYTAFNLNWLSDHLPLPELNNTNNIINKNIDISVINESPDLWPQINKSIADTSFLKMSENDLRLEVDNIGKFRAINGNRISWYKNNSKAGEKDVRNFLLGSMFGAILIQRNLLVMHGNALEKNGKTIVCLGSSGSGKSTLAYALIQNGWKFISDDVVAIDNNGYVLKGIPRLKLWEDSLEAFGLNKKSLDRVRDNLNKFVYKPENKFLALKDTKLSAFYLVNRFSRKIDINEENAIQEIKDEKTKVLYLRNNLYRIRFTRGLKKEGDIFIKLANLQKKISVSRLNCISRVDLLQEWLNKINL